MKTLYERLGGSVHYSGRDMKASHKGMRISDAHWAVFVKHLNATLDAFKIAQPGRGELAAFVQSTEAAMVEA